MSSSLGVVQPAPGRCWACFCCTNPPKLTLFLSMAHLFFHKYIHIYMYISACVHISVSSYVAPRLFYNASVESLAGSVVPKLMGRS